MIAEADLVFMNGAGLDTFLLALVPSGENAPGVIDLSEGLPLLRLVEDDDHAGEDEDHAGEVDPHVWMDPENVIEWTNRIAEALSAADPENAAVYQSNAAAYVLELQSLDTWIADEFSKISIEDRLLVTDHDSLGYFAEKYSFTVVGFVVPGFSTLAQPSAQEMAGLIDTIRTAGVPVIFVDPSFNPSLSQAVADDAGVSVVGIYTGSLSPSDGPAGSYLDLMRFMAEAIRENLAGK